MLLSLRRVAKITTLSFLMYIYNKKMDFSARKNPQMQQSRSRSANPEMDFHIHNNNNNNNNHHHHHHPLSAAGNSPSSSSSTAATTTTTSSHPHNPPPSTNDPMHSWWESISKARSRIESLSALLPPSMAQTLSSVADSDRPALSLLSSPSAYSAVASSLSGSSSDPLCHWLYDTYLSADPHLRLLVSSFLPLLSSLYLSLLHSSSAAVAAAPAPSLAGFEAVLLAVYSAECKSRAGKPLLVHVPDLSYPSLYHSPRNHSSSASASSSSSSSAVLGVGVLSPPLEPQTAVKSTKRACIVGVALDYFYKQISHMPPWSKIELCRAVASWAGQDCSCTTDLDDASAAGDDDDETESVVVSDGVSSAAAGGGVRIPLPWELLQPALRILGHCLLAPLNPTEVRDEAAVAVRRLYARASHDLAPQAILATRSLIQLDKRARADQKAAADVAAAVAGNSSSNVNTPTKAKKPEILLVSK